MKRKKVFVTGMSGYVGQCFCRELDRGTFCGRFYGMDVKEPLYKYDKGEFRKMDITDPALGDWMAEVSPDIVVHLAFVLQPVRDRAWMRKINVEGTRNVLEAAVRAGASQVQVTSSGTAYGAWPDNPVPLKETDPLRQHKGFQYASDKFEVEGMLERFVADHPEIAVSWVRPCVIYGPNVDNYISELFTLPVAMAPKADPVPSYQFVHEDDVADALLFLLKKEARGPFNLAPPDWVSIDEINAMTGKPTVPMPEKVLRGAFGLTWKLGLPLMKVPPQFSDFVIYPWLVDPGKLMDLGFKFRYSSLETIRIMLRAKGAIS